MLSSDAGRVMFPLRPELEKAEVPIVSSLLLDSNDTKFKLEQPPKALSPMLVSDAGRVMLPLRPDDWNALSPIVSTELGIKTEVIFDADRNVLSLISVTAVPISTELISVALHPAG